MNKKDEIRYEKLKEEYRLKAEVVKPYIQRLFERKNKVKAYR